MRGCGGAEAGPGSERGRRRAAWRRAGGGLRPEERSRPPPRPAPARAQAALGPGGRPWECAAAGRAEGRGSGQPPAPGLAGRGGACGGSPLGRAVEGPPGRAGSCGARGGGDRYSAAAPAEKLLYWRPASVCRGGGGWAGARLLLREGAGAPARPRSALPLRPLLTH